MNTLQAPAAGSNRQAHDLAESLAQASAEDVAKRLAELPRQLAASVLTELSPEQGGAVISRLDRSLAAELLGYMPPDDRTDVEQSLPEEVAADIHRRLKQRSPELALEVETLAQWDEHMAGGIMTTAVIVISPDLEVVEAMAEIRRAASEREVETLSTICVCDAEGRLRGTVALRGLILADPRESIESISDLEPVTVSPTADQEDVARVMAKYNLEVVPVIDHRGVLLGIVTVDDVIDVVIDEATEDAQLIAGVVPLERSFLATGLWESVWRRGAWLMVFFVAQLLTALVMEENEAFLAGVLDLAVFIPLVMSSGGNSGAQSSSLVIRALAVGEVRPGQWARILRRELAIGMTLGILLGLAGWIRALLGDSRPEALPIAVGVSLAAVVVLGNVLGALLPLALRKAGLDPAVSSNPFVMSVIDVVGLLAYFGISRAILTAIG